MEAFTLHITDWRRVPDVLRRVREERDRRMRKRHADLVRQGQTSEAARFTVAEEFGLSEAAVRKAIY